MLTAIAVEILGQVMTGKRQGLLLFVLYLLCGLAIYFGNLAGPLLKSVGLPYNRILTRLSYVLIPLALVAMIGFLGVVRTGSRAQNVIGLGIGQLTQYLQLPLINLEAVCQAIGLGPAGGYKPAGLLTGLLPYRLWGVISGNELPIQLPQPGIGTGFYMPLHINTGLPGIILFAFAAGYASRYFYNKSFTSLFHLLVYCQMAWALFAAHSYNHFLTLVFLPAPAICFLIFAILTKSLRVRVLPKREYAIRQESLQI